MKSISSKLAAGAVVLALAIPAAVFASAMETGANILSGFSPEGQADKTVETVKEQAQSVHQQLEDGTMTKKEAKEQLEEMGLHIPFSETELQQAAVKQTDVEMSEELKAQLQIIRQQLEDGTLTEEEANERIQALGLRSPFQIKKSE